MIRISSNWYKLQGLSMQVIFCFTRSDVLSGSRNSHQGARAITPDAQSYLMCIEISKKNFLRHFWLNAVHRKSAVRLNSPVNHNTCQSIAFNPV
jgi:hypothetical protein